MGQMTGDLIDKGEARIPDGVAAPSRKPFQELLLVN